MVHYYWVRVGCVDWWEMRLEQKPGASSEGLGHETEGFKLLLFAGSLPTHLSYLLLCS